MAKTLGDAITESRYLLQDYLAGNYRYSDDRLYAALNDAFSQVYRLRPDLYLSLDFTVPSYTSADSATAFPISEQYFSAVVYYVVGITELSDDEFTADGRAVTVMQGFKRELLGIEVQ